MSHAPQDVRTFFVSSATANRHAILQSTRVAELLIEVLQDNRRRNRFLLHEFVIMPDHFHVLLTPAEDISLEKAVQFIKGGFSYEQHRAYIHGNPVKRFLAESPEEFPYSSAYPDSKVDPVPPWLKPQF